MKNYFINSVIILFCLLLNGCQEEVQNEETIRSTSIEAKEKDKKQDVSLKRIIEASLSTNDRSASAVFDKEENEFQSMVARGTTESKITLAQKKGATAVFSKEESSNKISAKAIDAKDKTQPKKTTAKATFSKKEKQ